MKHFENIYAKKDNPSFNNSLLDGFVFKSPIQKKIVTLK